MRKTTFPNTPPEQNTDGKATDPQKNFIDKNVFNVLCEMDKNRPGFLKEIIKVFLESTPQIIQVLETAVEKNDAITIQEYAHSLKGRFANFGFQTASEACAKIGNHAKNNQIHEISSTLKQIEKEYSKAQKFLRNHLKISTD